MALYEHMKTTGVTYIVKYNFDLKGKTLVVPHGCCLSFDGGSIKNETVKSNDTKVSSGKTLIFGVTKIDGTWENKTVYSDNNCEIDNLIRYSYGHKFQMNKCVIKEREEKLGTKGLTMKKCTTK